jgi:hypothetical protein
MLRPYRLLLPIAAFAALAFAAAVTPGRAQSPLPSRFAFADTTLLRDTLDLRFGGLFQLADSLRMPPDSLRALSIRYLIPIHRLVAMADSMRVPVDSVGPVYERERYNPLAAQVASETAFTYGSNYAIGRQNRSWNNTGDYRLVRGALFTRNVTSVNITRTKQVGGTAEYTARNSSTEVGWRFTPNLSVGTRINLRRTDNVSPGAVDRSFQNDEYQFSVRTRQEPFTGFSSSLDLFGGPYDEPNSVPARRGFGSQVVGQASYLRGDWLSHDLTFELRQRVGSARQPQRPWFDTDEYSRSLQGVLGLFDARAIGARVGYRWSRTLSERPTTSGTGEAIQDRVSREETYGNGVDMDLRIRGSQDRQLTISGAIGGTRAYVELQRKDRFIYEPTVAVDRSLSMVGRYTLRGWILDANLDLARPVSEGPNQGDVTTADSITTVDYRERDRSWSRTANATLTRNVGRRIVVKANGTVALNSLRYSVVDTSYRAIVTGGFVTPTTPREDYRQSYRVDASYWQPNGFSTGLELEVARTVNLYLTGDRSAQSAEDRNYRAVWRWTHRLFRGLTVTQRNQMSANYRNLPLSPATTDALSLSYLTLTTLNAVVTPRLNMDLTHSRTIKPRGDYLGEENGRPSLRLSEETRDYVLSGTISYRPMPALTITLSPFYQSVLGEGTVGGFAVPRNGTTTLNIGGGVNLNVPVGGRGRLTGGIARQFNSTRTVRYRSGVPESSPRSDSDFWNGSLNLSWSL